MSETIPPVPKIIHALWLQGEQQAPENVRFVFRRWAALNPDYEMRVLNADDVGRLMVGIGIPSQIMTLQTVANIVRIRLLLDGGVWVDASLFPTRPLNTWLPDLVRPSGFFAFAQPGADRALSTWFLAAAPGHMIPRTWLIAMLRYWATPRTMTHYEGGVIPPDPIWEVDPGGGAQHPTFPYFWFPYLFGHLLKTDAGFAAAWARCRKLSAEPPHLVQFLFANGQPTHDEIRAVAWAAPVHKLDWRVTYPLAFLATL